MADPTWENTITYDGLELRNSDAMLVMSDGTALGSRGGVRPGDPGLTVTLAGSTINVSAGVAAVAYSAQGVYRAALPTSTSPGSVAAAHATLARIDLVYLRVWDTDVDASGLRQASAVYLAGTAGSGVAPTPAGTQIYIPLATISVPASGGGSPSVSTAVRPITVAPGGILPDAATAIVGSYTGQYRDNTSTGALERWSPSSWVPYPQAIGGIAPATLVNGTYVGQRRNRSDGGLDYWSGSAWGPQELSMDWTLLSSVGVYNATDTWSGSTGTLPVRMRKFFDHGTEVWEFNGAAVSTAGRSSSFVATLNSGFRVAKERVFMTGGIGSRTACRLSFTSDGKITLNVLSPETVTAVYFDGIRITDPLRAS